MKKGRPGYQVEVLIPPTDQTRMEELLLQQTTTFGVRSYTCSRRVLDRKQEQFASSFGPVRIKRGYYQGKCVRTSLEYEDLAALSDKTGIPLISLYTDIQKEITGGSTGKTVRTRSPCD